MAIKTSTFSGWRLTGEDANAFEKQVENNSPSPFASAALERGKPLAEEYLANGYIVFSAKKNPT